MASDKGQLAFVLDQMSGAGEVRARAMFGDYGIYCDDRIVALFCDDRLFVKPTESGRALLEEVVEAPPYPGQGLLPDRRGDRRPGAAERAHPAYGGRASSGREAPPRDTPTGGACRRAR
ncbi:MAG: TfoX/Sxy family protein [Thermoanaerobaculia bacterium]